MGHLSSVVLFMKESEFDIYRHCGKCKKPLSEHDRYNFGSQCPNDEAEFET
jgi:hypothetical protein